MIVTLKKENVFWHEIGHYCTQQLNKEYYGKYGCQGIEIMKEIRDGVINYTGGATPNKPPGYDPKSQQVNHPASMVGSLVYGCIFQSSFLNTPFANCFETQYNNANGFHDYNGVWGLAAKFFLSAGEKSKLNTLILEQLEVVRASIAKSAIFDIDISNFINTEEEKTWIPTEELDKLFADFIAQHGPDYKIFVDNVGKLFEGKKQYVYNGPGK